MNIVSIHAHPDDVEILGAGTMALLAAAGHTITIVTMTNGDCGSGDYDAEETARIRKQEASAAAAMIGASYRWGGFGDLQVFNDDAGRRKTCALIREVRPELVITASPIDYHCDHEATSALVRDSCFAAAVPNYAVPTGAPALEEIPHLYFMDSVEGTDREGRLIAPDFYVNIESTLEKKRAMLACHETQRVWLKKRHHLDNFLETMEQWTRACGERCGVKYAEGFRRYPGHPYPQTPLLESLLQGYVVGGKAS